MAKRVNIVAALLMVPVYIYKWFLSPLKGATCRHVPVCSSYAIEALGRHGPWRGLILSADRILRCRPGGTHGYDPVPQYVFRRYGRIHTVTGRWKSSSRLRQH